MFCFIHLNSNISNICPKCSKWWHVLIWHAYFLHFPSILHKCEIPWFNNRKNCQAMSMFPCALEYHVHACSCSWEIFIRKYTNVLKRFLKLGTKFRCLHIKVLECELSWAEPQVWMFVEPDGKWVPVGHQEPLTDVKLGAVYQQGAFCGSCTVNQLGNIQIFVVYRA